MKLIAFFLLAASVTLAQTPSKPAVPSAAKPAGTTAKSTTSQTTAAKKPAGDMPLIHGIVKPLFTERYAEIKIGTGALAEPYKLYHVHYSGYLAATGQKFDSSYDHRSPVLKDGKPVMGVDGKPELGDAQPMVFPQGTGRLIPGFDQGLSGMHIGGKRRIFIPWQLAYGTHDIPAREGHPGIPPKSDLIFDVELVDVTEMPAAPTRPMPPPAQRPANPAAPSAPPAGSAPGAPPVPTPPPAASAPAPSGSAPATAPQPK